MMKPSDKEQRSDEFQWVGDGTKSTTKRKTAIQYDSFKNGKIVVSVGDHVMVSNDDAPDPECGDDCYVARVVKLYDRGDSTDPERNRAVVQWYLRSGDLRDKKYRNAPTCGKSEVILDGRKKVCDTDVDAETIFQKCEVHALSPKEPLPECDSANSRLQLYVRWQLNGPKFLSIKTKEEAELGKRKIVARRSLFDSSSETSARRASTFDISEMSLLDDSYKTEKRGRRRLQSIDLKADSSSLGIAEGDAATPNSPPVSPIKNFYSKKSSVRVPKYCSTPIKETAKRAASDARRLTKGADGNELMRSVRIKLKKLKSGAANGDRASRSRGVSSDNRYEVTVISGGYTPVKKSKVDVRAVNVKKSKRNDSGDSGDASSGDEGDDERENKSSRGRGRPPRTKSITQTLPKKRTLRCRETVKDKQVNDNRTVRAKRKCTLETQRKLIQSDDESESDFSGSDSSPNYSEKSDASDEEDDDDNDSSNSAEKRRSSRSRSSKRTESKKIVKPSSKRNTSKRNSNPSPGISLRVGQHQAPTNSLEEARNRLHVSAVPDSLPCREEEYDEILSFVTNNLSSGKSGCIYISGVPGTGKTATVYEVLRNVTKKQRRGKLPTFQFVEVNGMKITEPRQAYVQIVKKLIGKKMAAEAAVNFLDKRFSHSAPRREHLVLLVDELDLLWTNRQDVLYNLFEWPSRPGSKLIVLAIANAMNLPERIMMNRVVSRIGMSRMGFQPYTHQQLQEIIKARLKGLEAFDPDATKLIARKVAALSGDARRALDICRRAAEFAGSKDGENSRKVSSVGVKHVDLAFQEMFSSPKILALQHSSLLEQYFMKAIVNEFHHRGLEETKFSSIYPHFKSLCRLEGVAPPNISTTFAICSQLGASRLLLTEDGRNGILQRIRLNMTIEDVNYALKDKLIDN